MYKLRSKITLEDVSAHIPVTAVFGPGALEALGLPAAKPGAAVALGGGVVFVDPRLPALGARADPAARERRGRCWSLRASLWRMSGLMTGFGWKRACRTAAAT